MKAYSIIPLAAMVFYTCGQDESAKASEQVCRQLRTFTLDSVEAIPKRLFPDRLSYRNISHVVRGQMWHAWVDIQDSSASLALHFNLEEKNTLGASYSPECWLTYPYELNGDQLVVYWDTLIDTKYGFDLVKSIKAVDPRQVGTPFMILELENDTTLKATYPLPKLIQTLNNSSKCRTFFPPKFTLSQEFYL